MTGAPYPYESYPSPGPTAPPGREHRTGDIIVTIVLLVVLLLGALLVTLLAAIFGVFAEAVESVDESTEETSSAAVVALVLVPTWGLWLLAVIVSTVLMIAKRLAFYVPLVALVLWFVLAALVF